jgi:divalent metal cation (Fe/Co/Zn/Cd) transporter
MVGSRYYMDTAVQVDGRITVREGHDIAHRIKKEVEQAFPDIADILIHIEPREK